MPEYSDQTLISSKKDVKELLNRIRNRHKYSESVKNGTERSYSDADRVGGNTEYNS